MPALDALTEWLTFDASRRAVVVAHNHVNRLLLARLFDWPLADYRRRVVQLPGALNVVGYDRALAPAIRRVNAVVGSAPSRRRGPRVP